MYVRPTSNIYMKPKQLKYKDWDSYICPAADVFTSDYWKCSNKNIEKCCNNNKTLSGYCSYDINPCDIVNSRDRRATTYLDISKPADNISILNQNPSNYTYPGYGYYYE